MSEPALGPIDEFNPASRLRVPAMATDLPLLYSIKGITPGVTTMEEASSLLSEWHPEASLRRGRAQLWCVNMSQASFTVACSRVEMLWLMFWEETLAAVEGEFPRKDIPDMKAAFAGRFGPGPGVSSWTNGVSTALVEIDEGGRCYFQVTHCDLFERYSTKLTSQLAEDRARHLKMVCADI